MNKKSTGINSLVIVCVVMGFLLSLNGCAATMQKRNVSDSGFLKNYSQLKPGKDDEALKVYIDESTDFNSYTKMIIAPVEIVVSKDSEMANVSAADRQKMADYFYAALNRDLGKHLEIVSTPGPGTARIRLALTDIKDKNVTMNTISSIMPIGIAIDTIGLAATGAHSFVGDASAEMEIVDSLSGKRIAAGVDARAGGRYTGGFDFSDWGNAKDACDYWSQRIAFRFDQLAKKAGR